MSLCPYVLHVLPIIRNVSFFCEGIIDNLVVPFMSVTCFFVYLVRTSGRTYQLQAKDKQTMMFWLQELQVIVLAFFFSLLGRLVGFIGGGGGDVFGKGFQDLRSR